ANALLSKAHTNGRGPSPRNEDIGMLRNCKSRSQLRGDPNRASPNPEYRSPEAEKNSAPDPHRRDRRTANRARDWRRFRYEALPGLIRKTAGCKCTSSARDWGNGI